MLGNTEKLILDRDLVIQLLDRYGSPLYVYDREQLITTIDRISSAIPHADTQFHFAAVTNGNIHLLDIFKRRGWGLHANTPGDIYLGLEAGFNPTSIVYSGSNLHRQEMEQVLDWGITTLNLDSVSQVEQLCQLQPSSRINLGLRLNLPALTGANRIGVMPPEFDRCVEVAATAGLKVRGLHFYRGTGTNATQAFTESIDLVIETAKLLPDWDYLDFGGGFGYPYQRGGVAFNWSEFGEILSQKLENLDRSIRLIIEPGRAAIAGCGYLLTRVVSTKWQGQKQIVGVDTSVANLSVPSVRGSYREIVPIDVTKTTDLYPTDVCGNTTYSRDYLGKNCQLPPLKIDDILAILDVGAYGYAMSSHFLHRPRPAEVLLTTTQSQLIRARESYGILTSGIIDRSAIE
jgi:diaminopimelate decarboxylase